MRRMRLLPMLHFWTIQIGILLIKLIGNHSYMKTTVMKSAQTVFKAVPEVHFILLFVPNNVDLGSIVDVDFTLFVCHRHQHCPQLYIRKARVEDYDDLMPIFMHQNEILRETYGEYFLAELIDAQDEKNHAVVCESIVSGQSGPEENGSCCF
uniref:Cilia- and flagella-associated protein 61 N-terminal domain-containing protein n=1 Tax=Chelonoidis abingdonii TaxID=106734 RepID=A0A8C0GND5_CHEAB